MKRNNIRAGRLLALLLAAMLLACGCTANTADVGEAAETKVSSPAAVSPDEDETDAAGGGAPQNGMGGGMPGGMGGMPGNTNAGVTVEVAAIHADLSNRDTEGAWDDAAATRITLSGATAAVDGAGAAFADGTLTISEAGVYVLSGAFAGGVTIEAMKDDKVQLVLNGAEITCDNGPALTVKKADKVFLSVAEGTVNALTDAATYANQDDDNEPDACVFSKSDLTINGAGALTITGNYDHGIVSKDALVVYDTALTVTAAGDGLKSNDGTSIAGDAKLTLTAGGDAVETEGDCIVESGDLVIQAGDDGIHADGGVYVNGGTVDVRSSVEGLEGLVVCIAGGTVNVVSTDDGLNATGDVVTTDTTAAATAADDAATQPGGRGGMGGGTFAVVPGAIIAVLGGKLTVHAGGDGLDSNGDLLIAGGETYVSATNNTADTAIDYNGGCELTGGTLVAIGGAGMLQSVKSGDELPVLCVTASGEQAANAAVTLADADGNTLLTYTPDRAWQNVILHAPGMRLGNAYTVLVDGSEICTVTAESAWTTYGETGGGFPGGRDGQLPGGQMKPDGQPPEGMEPPQDGGRGGQRLDGQNAPAESAPSASAGLAEES